MEAILPNHERGPSSHFERSDLMVFSRGRKFCVYNAVSLEGIWIRRYVIEEGSHRKGKLSWQKAWVCDDREMLRASDLL